MDKSGAIDFCALERELQAAVAADEKYWRENDAKFRAVHQKVASYEEFRFAGNLFHVASLELGIQQSSVSFIRMKVCISECHVVTLSAQKLYCHILPPV